MNDRDRMHGDDAMNELVIMGLKPCDAMLSNGIGEYLVIFNYSVKSEICRQEQLTLRFRDVKGRDRWWSKFRSRFSQGGEDHE